jgi:predicted  nucleic acid-binding Zn-ribbon protein
VIAFLIAAIVVLAVANILTNKERLAAEKTAREFRGALDSRDYELRQARERRNEWQSSAQQADKMVSALRHDLSLLTARWGQRVERYEAAAKRAGLEFKNIEATTVLRKVAKPKKKVKRARYNA